MTEPALTVRQLQVRDLDAYLANFDEVDAGSGVDGAPHFHPYGRLDTVDVEDRRRREVMRWTTPLTDVAWRRAWGLFDGDEMVGHLYLAGGSLRSGLHRVDLGMGVLAAHRGCGGGSLLLEAAIGWARAETAIDWIDLGVFAENARAQRLYVRHGFVEIGRTPDRYRVDGASLGRHLHDPRCRRFALRPGPSTLEHGDEMGPRPTAA